MPLPNTVRTAIQVGAVVASLSLSGCIFPKAGPPPGPLSSELLDVASQRWPDSSPESLEQGRQSFLASCDGCHSYPDLAHYAEDEWPAIVNRMGKQSDLSADESARLLQFILVARTGNTAENPPAAE